MNARAYFELMDAIAAARTGDEFAALRVRLTAIAMHPFERSALQRQLRHRELALDLDSGRGSGSDAAPRAHERRRAP